MQKPAYGPAFCNKFGERDMAEANYEERVITIPGVAPQPGGRKLVLDSVMVMTVEG